jgi:hypothetical protein
MAKNPNEIPYQPEQPTIMPPLEPAEPQWPKHDPEIKPGEVPIPSTEPVREIPTPPERKG